MNLDFLENDRWYAVDVRWHTHNTFLDIITLKCKKCSTKFSVKRQVLYGGVFDRARKRQLRVRCPGYDCCAWDWGGKNL